MSQLLLSQNNLQLDNQPTDITPPVDRRDVQVDHERLYNYLVNSFREAIRYKEYLSWVALREYDIKAYYMQKEAAWALSPWKGASSYRSPLTATLLDTAWANMMQSVWPEQGKPLQIKGSGREDVRTAKILEQYMNTVVENETNLKNVTDQNIFRMFLNGTGTIKTRRRLDGTSIDNSAVSVEDIYVPLNAEGFRVDQTEYVHQVIGLSKLELQMRKNAGIYDFRDGDIAPGLGITGGNARERIQFQFDAVTGTDSLAEQRNDIYFIIESYVTYLEENSLRPMELIVWWAPNGGKVLRVRQNETKIRPFSRYVVYEVPKRFYGISLPEKIREIQYKLDYSDKQYTDAMDRSNMPAMFLDDTSTFDPDVSQRVPGGIYPIGIGNKIIFEPQPAVERGFNEERFNLWMQAERLTGLTDISQGASTKSGRTLGETELRQTAAGTRFTALFQKYEQGWNDTCKIIYQYQDLYVPREKKVKIIGYEDYENIGELFPSETQREVGLGLGEDFNPNFGFSGRPITEREREEAEFNDYYLAAMANPATAMNPANFWRLLEEKAQRDGIRNHSTLVQKPKEANILSAEEFIQRVMSGQYNLQLRPGIDADNYVFEIELFMRSSMFEALEDRGKVLLMVSLQQAKIISMMERQALMDFNQFQMQTQMSAMDQQVQKAVQQNESQREVPQKKAA